MHTKDNLKGDPVRSDLVSNIKNLISGGKSEKCISGIATLRKHNLPTQTKSREERNT